jgi:hypothetical protein
MINVAALQVVVVVVEVNTSPKQILAAAIDKTFRADLACLFHALNLRHQY